MQEFINPTLEKLKKKQVFGTSATIPGQTFTIRDLLLRFQNGQRLPISAREINPLCPYDPEHPEQDSQFDESFDDACPQCGTFEDLQLALQSEQYKRAERVRKWKEEHANEPPEVKEPTKEIELSEDIEPKV